ncbi:MAG: hypothetical protein ACK2VD_12165 [Anaerolineae bacterium]
MSSDIPQVPRPPNRRLRAFAFDPILSRSIDTYEINEVTIELPWEETLQAGPVDDYVEVVDVDPASRAFYAPADLNHAHLLAQDGYPPSEGNPQFHQQMVYAVVRTTIGHFEQALGRRALWSPRLVLTGDGWEDVFVERLRIYPHALREANAYYSPAKKALLFGYFAASPAGGSLNLPGETVFACLSHDIVAHETTHALLDGLHRRFIEPSNVDVWALHEAFADIVALFQHFTYPEVLRDQIARTQGRLEDQNLLGELAYQFGQAIGHYGALRSALGAYDEAGTWHRAQPDPQAIGRTSEPHARGAILVAAVFDAFLTIYKRRIADLLRIASGGSGVLPPGRLHPDLVHRLAQEAAKTAGHILAICIRALDYCPPVDVSFGDYLRALVTADADLVTDDRWNYRLALIDAFRQHGIYPRDVRSLSVESLLWDAPTGRQQEIFGKVFGDPDRLSALVPDWGAATERKAIHERANESQRQVWGWLRRLSADEAAEAAYLMLDADAPPTYYRPYGREGVPAIEVHSVRPARRIGPDGQTRTEIVVELTQRRRGYTNPEDQRKADAGDTDLLSRPDFLFRGGCTLLVDPADGTVRYCVFKRIASPTRLERQRRYLTGNHEPSLRSSYYGDPRRAYYQQLTSYGRGEGEAIGIEPFALLHRSFGQEV